MWFQVEDINFLWFFLPFNLCKSSINNEINHTFVDKCYFDFPFLWKILLVQIFLIKLQYYDAEGLLPTIHM